MSTAFEEYMAPQVAELAVAKRNDKAVKIARDLALKAKLIAETKGVSLAQYLSTLLRPHIEKDWPKAVKKVDEIPPEDGEERPTNGKSDRED